jgi:ligand-binding SRPBCC domain-containing protein
MLKLDDQVTFEAKHLGIRRRLTAQIVQFEPPNLFTDKMLKGAFKSLNHEHHFRIEGESTRMTDVVELEAPFGVLGRLAEKLFLGAYMRRLLVERGEQLKTMAEANAAQEGISI